MLETKLGIRSEDWPQVDKALEETAELPHSKGPLIERWAMLCDVINASEKTDIKYLRQDWGYWFSYTKLESLVLLKALKQKYGL